MTQTFSLFRYSSIGDVEGLKRLFKRGEVHPSSSFLGGWTALHYAISNAQAAVCRLLLNEKADPMIEDGENSQSALEWAWCKILGKSFESGRLLEFQSIFTDRECLEEMGFTRIHKLVFGFEHGDAEAEIRTADADSINKQDFGGRTALSWAAQRGDIRLVNLLLAQGADPNITTPNKMSPLHYAVEALNPSCIKPLLEHGADVHATDHPLGLHNSLHFACDHQNNIEYLVPLVEAGIDVEARTFYSYTPIVAAVCSNHWVCVEYLLDHGADINGRAQYGQTPMIYAIECNAHECLRVFVRRGANHKLECESGPTIAHFAARYADLETMQILNEANLQPLPLNSLEMEGSEGLTISEIITKRLQEGDCAGEAFTTAFDVFMEKIVNPDDLEGSQEGERRISEEWEDALEGQIDPLGTT